MNFNFLDQAFDLEKVGKQLVDIGLHDEFPSKASAHANSITVTAAGETFAAIWCARVLLLQLTSITPNIPSAVNKSKSAKHSWESIDLEGRKPEWEHLCQQLTELVGGGGQSGGGPSATAWQQRAQDAEYKLLQVLSLLVAAPDPLPFVDKVENKNRELQAVAENLCADQSEVEMLVEKHRQLEAQYKELVKQAAAQLVLQFTEALKQKQQRQLEAQYKKLV
eukprot:gene30968-8914_t